MQIVLQVNWNRNNLFVGWYCRTKKDYLKCCIKYNFIVVELSFSKCPYFWVSHYFYSIYLLIYLFIIIFFFLGGGGFPFGVQQEDNKINITFGELLLSGGGGCCFHSRVLSEFWCPQCNIQFLKDVNMTVFTSSGSFFSSCFFFWLPSCLPVVCSSLVQLAHAPVPPCVLGLTLAPQIGQVR